VAFGSIEIVTEFLAVRMGKGAPQTTGTGATVMTPSPFYAVTRFEKRKMKTTK
jgi:hypothetical protein